jgi:hypothetical protein
MTTPHSIETPRPDRHTARPIFPDGTAFENTVPISVVVPCAGITTAYVRLLTATAGGSLEIRLRRTNGTEYPVAVGPANTTITAGTLSEVTVSPKGAREFVVRFVPSGDGTVTYCDVGFLMP